VKPTPLSLIAAVCSGALNESARVLEGANATGFFVDSRAVSSGQVFVAIPGERVDGHSYAASAVRDGAIAALVSDEVEGIPCIVVQDTVEALGRIAQWYRREVLQATVVGVTGSSGKTTTKDLIAEVLEGCGEGVVVAARGSFNTEVGVPLTILEADEETRFLVLEMGMRGLRHIAYLAHIAQPDIGVVLNVGSAHVGMMNSPDDIAVAKGELLEALTEQGYAIVNADDPQVSAMTNRTSAHVVRFGADESADVTASNIRLDSLGKPSFDLTIAGDDAQRVSLQLHGEHFVESALAAASVGYVCGMDSALIAQRLSGAVSRSPWRMEVTSTDDGVTVISDVYNANPESMRAALKALRSMAGGGRTWAVLGEMRELGDSSLDQHDAIGRLAVRLDISRLVCIGQATKVMHLAASNEGSWGEESTWVPDTDAAIELLDVQVQPGDVVLVKASRSVGLEVVADHLLGRRSA
jgi:UDP-N-acetylmuramoyl-tripeptide--D-alanyl-D-alanine ligase